MATTYTTNPNASYSNITIPIGGASCTTAVPNYSITGAATAGTILTGPTSTWSNNPAAVQINEDGISMAHDTDITIGNQSLKDFMQAVNDRLAILVPDPKLLEEFEALKQAYEHYKTLESLCIGGKKSTND